MGFESINLRRLREITEGKYTGFMVYWEDCAVNPGPLEGKPIAVMKSVIGLRREHTMASRRPFNLSSTAKWHGTGVTIQEV